MVRIGPLDTRLLEQTTSPHPKIKGFVIALLFRPEGLVHDYLRKRSGEIGAEKSGQRQATQKGDLKKKNQVCQTPSTVAASCHQGAQRTTFRPRKSEERANSSRALRPLTGISFPANTQPGCESRQARQWVLSWLVTIWEQTFALCLPHRWGFRQPRHLSSHHLFRLCRS